MLPTINFTKTEAYKYLADHFIDINEKSLKDLFTEDPERFEKFSILFEDILVDFSKNRIDDTTMALLIQLAKECKLDEAIKAMFGARPFQSVYATHCNGESLTFQAMYRIRTALHRRKTIARFLSRRFVV